MSGVQKEARTDSVAGSSTMIEPPMMVEGEGYFNSEQPAPAWTTSACSQLCRMCATENEYLIPIFDGEGVEHQLGMKIDKHLPIRVHVGDTLPLHVCYQCASTLIAWHDLVVGCIEAEKKLLQIQSHGRAEGQVEEVDVKSSDTSLFYAEQMDSEQSHDPNAVPGTSAASARLPPKKTVPKANPKLKMVIVKTPSLAAASSRIITPKTEAIPDTTERSPEDLEADAPEAAPCVCADCDAPFAGKPALRRHLRRDHGSVPESFQHGRRDHGAEPIGDEGDPLEVEAAALGDEAAALEEEAVRAEGDGAEEAGPAACDYCAAEFADSDALRAHGEAEHSLRIIEGQHFFTCGHCNLSFLDFDVFECHADEHADGGADADDENVTYKCDVCGAIFLNYKGIVAHVKKAHPGCKIANLPCNKCHASFASRAALREHRRGEHAAAAAARAAQNAAGDFECGERGCGKAYATAHGVAQHVAKFHRRDRSLKFPCAQCDKTFTTVYSRASHMTTHTGELNFPCELCGKAFRLGSSLKEHLLTHTDLMPEECYVCGKRFRKKTALRTHLRVHTGERPYPCEICGRRFRQSGDRNKHRNNVHRLTVNMKLE